MMDTDNQAALVKDTTVTLYRIRQCLGRGGFGITYLALDTLRNRPVVLKEFFPSNAAIRFGQQTHINLLSADKRHDFEEGLRRFKREAQVLSAFDHPNVVKVVGLFEANNTAYFVMEYIEGQSLAQRVQARQRRFTEAEIAVDLMPVLNGIEAVHQAGILHLDIKPDNILTSKYGEPLLIDFGGARYATGKASNAHSTMIATPGYAPHEQYTLAREQTRATDLYAFGMTLRCLMAPAAHLADANHRGSAHTEQLPDPLGDIRQLAPGYSDALYQVVEGCTRMVARERPQSVADIRTLLASWPLNRARPETARSRPIRIAQPLHRNEQGAGGQTNKPDALAAKPDALARLTASTTTQNAPQSVSRRGRQSTVKSTPQSATQSVRWTVIAVACVALLVLLGGLGYQFYQGSTDQCKQLFDKSRYKTAYPACLEAARWGHLDSQEILAWMYFAGRGVRRDYAEAFNWYQKGADQGSAYSQYSMGIMYLEGHGIARDDAEAAHWFGLSAAQGHAKARLAMSDLCREKGVGC